MLRYDKPWGLGCAKSRHHVSFKQFQLVRSLFLNCYPFLATRIGGSPYLRITLSHRNCVIYLVVIQSWGLSSVYFMKVSIATIRNFLWAFATRSGGTDGFQYFRVLINSCVFFLYRSHITSGISHHVWSIESQLDHLMGKGPAPRVLPTDFHMSSFQG